MFIESLGMSTLIYGVCDRYLQVRAWSEALCRPLAIEDYIVQSMPDVSPPKWHLAHVTWFFETFLLVPFLPGYQCFHPRFGYLFNSYYEAVGDRHPRPQRGLLSRPTVEEVYGYRAYVDEAMKALLKQRGEEPQIAALLELGLHHEQQHQELLVTDIKHILAINPLRPAYRQDLRENRVDSALPLRFEAFAGGLVDIGWAGSGSTFDKFAFDNFAFDNEGPRHRTYVQDFAIANRPVTNGEYLEFIEAGGYQQPQHWLSEGWHTLLREGWEAPLYWEKIEGQWQVMTLGGMRPLNLQEPVCHVSLFEADAYASWAGKRLPTEVEWEVAAQTGAIANPLAGTLAGNMTGNFAESQTFHPQAQPLTESVFGLQQFFGDVWEWTQSAYLPYPGFKPAPGAIGEYNGKFMCNQRVLRGGSCATPRNHIRVTYRNFFPPASRWQFMGIRLAQ